MARVRADKSPEEVRYLLNRKGLTFADVDRLHGLKSGIARQTARHPHVHGEQALAEAVGLTPQQLWPSRYDARTGERLKPQPSENYKDRPRLRHCQKRRAA
ncbi:helix-turn-helix domain-containing protein [Marivibrio halodurans]|uniref:Helix-turn-helix domain-containing protein n=1 Tax=Marivibrio halodurans TaxID=2039722 RepID=A0A8J7V433_9PROT|nr:helix-turn-helix domain-containing protein [Marivibrio halodurans]MBP5857254.1 helix-turn-helix domain-containing protein [Marivibrio halodurans]